MYFTKKDIVLKLRKSGIKKGDIVFFNTSFRNCRHTKKKLNTIRRTCVSYFLMLLKRRWVKRELY